MTRGQDYVTVHLRASLIDYTTDEQGPVIDGSAVEPVKFEALGDPAARVAPERKRTKTPLDDAARGVCWARDASKEAVTLGACRKKVSVKE